MPFPLLHVLQTDRDTRMQLCYWVRPLTLADFAALLLLDNESHMHVCRDLLTVLPSVLPNTNAIASPCQQVQIDAKYVPSIFGCLRLIPGTHQDRFATTVGPYDAREWCKRAYYTVVAITFEPCMAGKHADPHALDTRGSPE